MKRLFKGCGVFILLAVVVGIAIAVAMNSGGDDEGGNDKTANRCLDVPQPLADGIQSGIEDGITGSGWQALKSNDFEDVYMVAAKLSGPGMGDDTYGVWATNSLDVGETLILSVDGIAQEFSEWPDGDTTDARTSPTDDDVDEARDCVS